MIRKKLGIPAVSRPPGNQKTAGDFCYEISRFGIVPYLAAEAFLHIDPVPIHIDACDRQRNIFIFKCIRQGKVLVLSVPPIATPPIAETKAWDQRSFARDTVKIL